MFHSMSCMYSLDKHKYHGWRIQFHLAMSTYYDILKKSGITINTYVEYVYTNCHINVICNLSFDLCMLRKRHKYIDEVVHIISLSNIDIFVHGYNLQSSFFSRFEAINMYVHWWSCTHKCICRIQFHLATFTYYDILL